MDNCEIFKRDSLLLLLRWNQLNELPFIVSAILISIIFDLSWKMLRGVLGNSYVIAKTLQNENAVLVLAITSLTFVFLRKDKS